MNRLDLTVARNVYKLYYRTYPNVAQFLIEFDTEFCPNLREFAPENANILFLGGKTCLRFLEYAAHLEHWYISATSEKLSRTEC